MSGNYVEACDGLVPMRNNFLLPTAKLDDQKFEFYFLVDMSGSMRGRPYELACRAILVNVGVFYFRQFFFHLTLHSSKD